MLKGCVSRRNDILGCFELFLLEVYRSLAAFADQYLGSSGLRHAPNRADTTEQRLLFRPFFMSQVG